MGLNEIDATPDLKAPRFGALSAFFTPDGFGSLEASRSN